MAENNKGRDRFVVEGGVSAECVAALVYTTYPTKESAIAAGKALVEAGRAGCINIIPAMTAVYVWNGVTEVADEVVLIAKVTPGGAKTVCDAIRQAHPYETPAILVLPVAAAGADYLDWLRAGVKDISA